MKLGLFSFWRALLMKHIMSRISIHLPITIFWETFCIFLCCEFSTAVDTRSTGTTVVTVTVLWIIFFLLMSNSWW
jgi:hypothetical protein